MGGIDEAPRLGDLELAVLDEIWSRGPIDVKSAHRTIGRRRQITLNTVQSTLERLFRKGLLAREKVGHAYVYSTRISREELTQKAVAEIIGRFGGDDAGPMLSAFIDLAARAGDEALHRLERLIARHRRKHR